MINVCRFTGYNLDKNCPLDDYNYQGHSGPIDFENNSYWNSKSSRNLQSGLSGGSDERLRRINGPLRVNGDVYVEGDIISQGGGVFLEEVKTEAGITLSDLKNENNIFRNRLDEVDKIMQYLSKRFSIDFNNIDEKIKELKKRDNVDKRLDAIE